MKSGKLAIPESILAPSVSCSVASVAFPTAGQDTAASSSSAVPVK
jgi:hypothetical protein